MIDRPDLWLEALDDRGKMSHTYDFKKFEQVIERVSELYIDDCFTWVIPASVTRAIRLTCRLAFLDSGFRRNDDGANAYRDAGGRPRREPAVEVIGPRLQPAAGMGLSPFRPPCA